MFKFEWPVYSNKPHKAQSTEAPYKSAPEEPKKDISEPVIQILKAMEERPETFNVEIHYLTGYTKRSLDDTATGFKVEVFTVFGDIFHTNGAGWMTQDEMKEVFNAASNIMIQRSNEAKQEARNAVIELYKGE